MARGQLIDGFDYRTGQAVQKSRADWRDALAQVVNAGGRRRVDGGETFAHGKDGLLLFEVYAVVPV